MTNTQLAAALIAVLGFEMRENSMQEQRERMVNGTRLMTAGAWMPWRNPLSTTESTEAERRMAVKEEYPEVGRFLKECCGATSSESPVQFLDLYHLYQAYMEERKLDCLKPEVFKNVLENGHGIKVHRGIAYQVWILESCQKYLNKEQPADQPEVAPPGTGTDRMLTYFKYEHLPPHLQLVSKPFCDLANQIVETIPSNPERTVALRKLLESKDCAVRAVLPTE